MTNRGLSRYADLVMGVDAAFIALDVFTDVSWYLLYLQIGIAMWQGVMVVNFRRRARRDKARDVGLW